MAASIALAAVALVATASAAFTPDGRVDSATGSNHRVAALAERRDDLCRVVVDLAAPPSGTWAALRPTAPVASAIVFGVERAQIDPLCLALAFRAGKGWGALMSVAEVIWRASMVPPWSDGTLDVKSRGSVCAAL